MSRGNKVPASARITKIEVGAENTACVVQIDFAVLHMDVVNAVWECLNDLCGVNELVNNVRWVEVKAKSLAVVRVLLVFSLTYKCHRRFLRGEFPAQILRPLRRTRLKWGSSDLQILYNPRQSLRRMLAGSGK